MHLCRLERDALFIITDPRQAWALPRGTVVDVLHNVPSPITERDSELHVSAPDVSGRVWRGWIARNAKLTPVRRGSVVARWHPLRTFTRSRTDELRELILQTKPRGGYDRHGRPVDPWTALAWVSQFGREHVALLVAVVRELGGGRISSDDTLAVIRRAAELVLNEEITMSTIKKNRKSTAAAPAPKAEVETAGRTSMAESTGQKLLEVTSKIKKSGVVGTIAQRLANGADVSHKDLVALRDGINTLATELRGKGKPNLASRLSSQNQMVRRLERAAR